VSVSRRGSGTTARARGAQDAAELERTEEAARTAIDLDRVIHERLRLGIVSALASRESLSFNDLKAALKTTDGNLSVHARRLEEAGYIECQKGYVGRVPRTTFRLTPAGRKALERYLAHMEALIQAARGPA
jgi:DNA-binding MarR family transcriptional regulator